MKTYYYSAFLLVCGAIYSFLSPNGSSSDNSRKEASVSDQATSAADEPARIKPDDSGTYPMNLCKQFIQASYCESADEAAGKDVLRDDIAEPRFIVATVPDPATTHLRVEFDRAIDGIKDAAADERYLLQRYWFPWPPNASRFSDRASQAAEEKELAARRRHPGILLFENSDHRHSLVVFLVGESPTNGIDRQQFNSALQMKKSIEDLYDLHKATSQQWPRRLYVLGTSFSGSLPTLQLALDENHLTDFEAVSGTASDEGSIRTFNDHFPENSSLPHLRTLMHSSTSALKKFLEYLEGTWHYYGKTAILSETDTVFGALQDFIGDKRVFSIPFPRDIAHLRNAYQSYPELSGFGPGSPDPQQSKNLPLPLEDQLNTIDSIPDFAAQTVVSQETMALQIANRIRHEHIHFAGIIGSDILDVLFISRFVRAANPDTRLFLLDPDLLFVHAADTLPFEGILAITTYPLLDGNPPLAQTTVREGEAHWMFPAPFQQGIHNASRVLAADISSMDAGHPGCKDRPLAGYEIVNANDNRPALWITSVGRESFVPIAALAMGTKEDEGRDAALMPVSGGRPLLKEVHDPTRLWWILLVGFTLAIVWITRVFYRAQGSSASWMTDYRFEGRTSYMPHLGFLLIFVVGIYLVIASTGIPLLAHPVENPTAALPFALCAALGLTAIVFLSKLWLERSRIKSTGRAWVGFAGACLLLTFALFLYLSQSGKDLSGVFFTFRSYELSAGASPTVPFLFLLCGFMIWSFVSLQRDIFLHGRRQILPRAKGDTILSKNIRPAAGRLEQHLHHPFRTSWRVSLSLAAGAFILCWLGLNVSGLRSFEGVAYDQFFVAWASALGAALIVTASHFLQSWLLLDPILDQLEMHPLRRGLKALPPDESWSPIWQANPRERSYLILTRSIEALAALRNADLGSGVTAQISDAKRSIDAILIKAAKSERQTDVEHLRSQFALKLAADRLIVRLQGQWQAGSSEIVEWRSADKVKDTGEAANPQSDEAPPLVYALEFVAMRYLAFIRYVMLQLRNMLTFLTLGFLAFAFALMSYPFQGERLIAWVITGLFLVLSSMVVFVFAQMDSDPVLGRITNRDGLKSGFALAHRLLAYGALPLLTVLASNFNGVGRLLFSWIQPVLKTLH